MKPGACPNRNAMTDPDRKGPGILVVIGRAFSFLMLAFFAILVLVNIGFEGEVGAILDILWHLITGFVRFLDGNLRRVSSSAETWGPGLAAFFGTVFVGHRILRSWSRKRRHPWPVRSTICIALLLPVFFIISFLLPGMLLQLRGLAGTPWFEHQRTALRNAESQVLAVNQAVRFWQIQNETKAFPPSLATLIDSKVVAHPFRGDGMADPPIYLGAGLTLDSDPALPLLISSSYEDHRIPCRIVLTVDGSFETITEDDLNDCINRSLAARDQVKR